MITCKFNGLVHISSSYKKVNRIIEEECGHFENVDFISEELQPEVLEAEGEEQKLIKKPGSYWSNKGESKTLEAAKKELLFQIQTLNPGSLFFFLGEFNLGGLGGEEPVIYELEKIISAGITERNKVLMAERKPPLDYMILISGRGIQIGDTFSVHKYRINPSDKEEKKEETNKKYPWSEDVEVVKREVQRKLKEHFENLKKFGIDIVPKKIVPKKRGVKRNREEAGLKADREPAAEQLAEEGKAAVSMDLTADRDHPVEGSNVAPTVHSDLGLFSDTSVSESTAPKNNTILHDPNKKRKV